MYPSSSYYSDNSQAEPLVRRSVATSSLWKTGFYNEGLRVRFTVDKVAVEWASTGTSIFPCQYISTYPEPEQSIFPHPTSWRSILILSNLHVGLPSGLSLVSHHQNLQHTSLVYRKCYTPRPSHSSKLDHYNKIWREVQILKLLIMYSSPLPY